MSEGTRSLGGLAELVRVLRPGPAKAAAGIPDAVLVQQARGGSQVAFCELVRRHQGKARALLLRLCGDAATADDLAQEVFVRAYRGLDGFEGRSAFSTWVYRIAYNVFLSQRGRYHGHAPLSDAPEREPCAASDDSPGRADLRRDLAAAVADLPERYRAVVALHYLQDVSYPEIAEILDLPIGTVKTHLHRARAQLRGRMLGWVEPQVESGEVAPES